MVKVQWRNHNLNRLLQDIARNFDDDVIIVTLIASAKNVKNLKYYAISLNSLNTGELCGTLRYTALL